METKPAEKPTLPPRWVPGRPVVRPAVPHDAHPFMRTLDAVRMYHVARKPPIAPRLLEVGEAPPPVVTVFEAPCEPPPLRTRSDHGCTPRYWDSCDWGTLQDDELEALGLKRPDGDGYRCCVPPPPAKWKPETLQPAGED